MSSIKCPNCKSDVVLNNGIYTCGNCGKSFRAKTNKPDKQHTDDCASVATNETESTKKNISIEFKEQVFDKLYFWVGILLGFMLSIVGLATACFIGAFIGRKDLVKGSFIGTITSMALGALSGIIYAIVIACLAV